MALVTHEGYLTSGAIDEQEKGSSRVLKGDEALRRVRQLLENQPPILTVLVYEANWRDGAPRVFACGTAAGACIVAPDKETLTGILKLTSIIASSRAADTINQLRAKGIESGHRWIDVETMEKLLLSGEDFNDVSTALEARGLAPLVDPTEGLQALEQNVTTIATWTQHITPLLKRQRLVDASRLETATTTAIADLEWFGLPFKRHRWDRMLDRHQHERDSALQTLNQHRIALTLESLNNPALFGNILQNAGLKAKDTKRETLMALPDPMGPCFEKLLLSHQAIRAYGGRFLSFDRGDGRLRSRFEQIGASTGRLSSHSPNLQSISAEDEARNAFSTAPGRILVVADYAGCELRILAEMSGDETFQEAFQRDEDLHAKVASKIWKREVTKDRNPELRHRAKAINFGLMYGMGPEGLAKRLTVTKGQAQTLMDDYFGQFPKVRQFLDAQIQKGLREGAISSVSGRTLKVDRNDSKSSRIARNMPIQGSSADITKYALSLIRAGLIDAGLDAHLVHTVHDEILVEGASTDREALSCIVKSSMERAGAHWIKNVPMKADVSVGDVWAK